MAFEKIYLLWGQYELIEVVENKDPPDKVVDVLAEVASAGINWIPINGIDKCENIDKT